MPSLPNLAPWARTVPLVAGTGVSSKVRRQADQVCSGTADQVKINRALSDYKVAQLFGQFSTVDSIVPTAGSSLLGFGRGMTKVTMAAASNHHMVAPAAASGEYTIRDLTFDQQKALQTDANVNIIQMGNAGYSGDSKPILEDLILYRAKNVGLFGGAGVREAHIKTVSVIQAGYTSVYLDVGFTDGVLEFVRSDNPTGHGFQIVGTNNCLSFCKGFGSGWLGGSSYDGTKCGLIVDVGNGQTVTALTLLDFEAQENGGNGVLLYRHGSGVCFGINLISCRLTSNNIGLTGAVGLSVNDVPGVTVDALVAFQDPARLGQQEYAMQLQGALDGFSSKGGYFENNHTGQVLRSGSPTGSIIIDYRGLTL